MNWVLLLVVKCKLEKLDTEGAVEVPALSEVEVPALSAVEVPALSEVEVPALSEVEVGGERELLFIEEIA